MACNFFTARSEMYALVKAAWQGASAIVGEVPDIRYHGVPKPQPPDPDKHWARVAAVNTLTPQTAFVGTDPGPGRKQHTTYGVLTVTVYAPMSQMQGYAQGLQLGEMVQGALRNVETPSSVWFRNATLKELASDSKSYRFQVVVEYEFDTLTA